VLSVGSGFVLNASRRAGSVRRLIGEGSQGAVFEWRSPMGPVGRVEVVLPQHRDRCATSDGHRPHRTRGARSEIPVADGVRRARVGAGIRLPHAASTRVLGRPLRVAHREGRRTVLGDLFAGHRTGGQLSRAPQRGPLLPRHQFRQRLLRSVDRSPTHLRQRQRGIDGASPSYVLGTRRFMAPEIVRREASPSTATDLYSLSVLCSTC